MISDELKFVFMHIPKTGGSSVGYFLRNVSRENIKIATSRLGPGKGISVNDKDNGKNVKHISLIKHLKDEPMLQNYYKFTIVRNPYDRAMSYYFWYKGNKTIKNGFDKEEFKLFISRVSDHQSDYIVDPVTNEIIVDQIIKYESLIPGLSSIPCLKKFNFKNLPRINVSRNSRMSCYDTELKEFIYKKYERDFKILGYPK
jgi:hypothetical protein